MLQLVDDGQFLAVFNSTHRVLAAEGVLKGQRIPMLLIPAPRSLQTDCGLAIRFSPDDHDRVLALLRDHHLLPAYLCRCDGDHFTITEEFSP